MLLATNCTTHLHKFVYVHFIHPIHNNGIVFYEILLGCYRYKTTELQEYLLCVLGYVQHIEHSVGVDTTQYIVI